MKRNLSAAVIGLLLSQQANARHPLSRDACAVFREAVENYQMFVVPHCAPDEVRTYVTARADRDRAFVRSLRNTKLAAVYKQAVADRAARDSSTVYECFGPPLPPPPAPGTVPLQRAPARTDIQRHDTLAEHFAGGDRQFETMARLRNAFLGRPCK